MKEIIIDGVEYELHPKNKIPLTGDEFINHMLNIHNIKFRVGDTVRYKGKSIRKECGTTKFKVLSFEPHYLNDGTISDDYLDVNLQNLSTGDEINFLTIHLEKCKKEKDNLN